MSKSFAIIGSRGFPSTYGGFETFVRHLAPFLVREGHEVVVYGRDGRYRGEQAPIDGVRRVKTFGVEGRSSSTLSYGLTSSWDARKRAFDAALVLNVANGYYLPLLRHANIPVALNVDGVEWERRKWGRAARLTFLGGARATGRWADALIADSVAIGDYWEQRFGRSTIFIPYGAEVRRDVSTNLIRELGLSAGSYVLAVARLVPENNIGLLLDAAKMLPADIPIVVVGSGHDQSDVVKRLREEAGQNVALKPLGHVADQELLAQLWANCAVYFHGHSVGGTNPALLQAMGFGAPVLALDTVFNREVLQSDNQLVPDDPELVAECLRQILKSPEMQGRWRESEQRRISEAYTWKSVCRKYLETLVHISNARPGA